MIAIAPVFEWIGGGFAAAFIRRTLVGAAGGMRLDFVRRAPHDVNPAAIGFPAGNARGVMLVGIGDAAIVLFLKVFSTDRGRDRGAARIAR